MWEAAHGTDTSEVDVWARDRRAADRILSLIIGGCKQGWSCSGRRGSMSQFAGFRKWIFKLCASDLEYHGETLVLFIHVFSLHKMGK